MKKIDINISENVDFYINKSNEVKTKEANEISQYVYKCIFFCPINKLECVNSMDIYNDILVFGTIMGNVQLCHIDKNNLLPKKKKKIIFKEDDKKSNFSNKKTDKNSKGNNENKMKQIYLKKYKENENVYYDDDNVDSHYNLTYSNVNNKNNNEIEEDNSEKDSKKVNGIKTKKITVNNINKKESNSQKEEKEIIYTNKIENLEILENFENEHQPQTPYPQISNLVTSANENISCIVFETKDNIIFSSGDEELFKMENISTWNMNIKNSNFIYSRKKNYEAKSLHLINCENTICFLTPTNFLMLNIPLGDFVSTEITQDVISYVNRNIKNFEKIENIRGAIESTNFTVPFDFDGINILYIEYTDKNSRKICVYNTIKQKSILDYDIDKNFGHVSFMKFMPDDKIFLVRNSNICEIYDMNEGFFLVEKWQHFGDEIISVQIYIEGTKISEDFLENDNNLNNISNNISFNVSEKEEDKVLNIKFNNINQFNSSSRDLKKRHSKELSNDKLNKNDIDIYNKKYNNDYKEEIIDLNIYKKFGNNKKINYNKKDFYVATLDYDGNFNLYKNKKNKVLFNLYNIEGIEQKYKDEEFFYLRFPYFISMNSKYICISTDQGVFAITKILT